MATLARQTPTLSTADRAASSVDPKAAFQAIVAKYRHHLHVTDDQPLKFILGALAANHYDADPVWPMMLGGPGSGKTELLRALSKLHDVYEVSVLTEAGLLSGVAKKDRNPKASGGLLREIGNDSLGFIVLKDFGGILSMNRDARAGTLAALREIYDGSWTRRLGADGGSKLTWHGKVALISAGTNAVDLHQGAMASLGERFIYYRLHSTPVDREKQGAAALDHIGQTSDMREELADAVRQLFDPLPRLPNIQEFLTPNRRSQVVALANLASLARSAVERDSYSHDVVLVPEPESPTRLATGLSLLLGGMTAIGVTETDAWDVVRTVALDSIPPTRRAVLEALLKTRGQIEFESLRRTAHLRCSTTTVRRSLEDLESHRVVGRDTGQKGKSLWRASDWARTQFRLAGFTLCT